VGLKYGPTRSHKSHMCRAINQKKTDIWHIAVSRILVGIIIQFYVQGGRKRATERVSVLTPKIQLSPFPMTNLTCSSEKNSSNSSRLMSFLSLSAASIRNS